MIELKNAYPRSLSPQGRLLRYLDELGETGLYIVKPFSDIEKWLEISHSSFKRYLAALQEADVLKYNVAHNAIILNPRVFRYNLTENEHYLWQCQYRAFIAA